jgi:hypothetical protein
MFPLTPQGRSMIETISDSYSAAKPDGFAGLLVAHNLFAAVEPAFPRGAAS